MKPRFSEAGPIFPPFNNALARLKGVSVKAC
jgi:hypothetical protein